MPKIAGDVLHERSAIEAALLAAGQFAHASCYQIGQALDDIYDMRQRRIKRRHWRGEEINEYKRAIHDHFVMGFAGGYNPQIYAAAPTLAVAEKHLGILCPLCSEISHPRGPWDWEVRGSWIDKFCCPSILEVDGYSFPTYAEFDVSECEFLGGAVCEICRRAITRYWWKNLGLEKSPETCWFRDFTATSVQQTLAALCNLAQTPSFRVRLRENKWRKLRFNPVRPIKYLEAA